MFKGDLEGDLERDLEGDLEVELEGELEVDLEGDSKRDFRGDFKQDMEGDLLSSSGQVRSRLGLFEVWFSLQIKFNSFELDSEVGRLVIFQFSPLHSQARIKHRSLQGRLRWSSAH